MEDLQRIGVIHMKQFNIKKFKQIEVNELEANLKVIEATIKPTQFKISTNDIGFVQETLGINSMVDKEGLTTLRNSICEYYKNKIKQTQKRSEDYFHRKTMQYVVINCAIAHCIDIRLTELETMDK